MRNGLYLNRHPMLVGPLFITDVTHDTHNSVSQMESASSQGEKKEPETLLLLAFRVGAISSSAFSIALLYRD